MLAWCHRAHHHSVRGWETPRRTFPTSQVRCFPGSSASLRSGLSKNRPRGCEPPAWDTAAAGALPTSSQASTGASPLHPFPSREGARQKTNGSDSVDGVAPGIPTAVGIEKNPFSDGERWKTPKRDSSGGKKAHPYLYPGAAPTSRHSPEHLRDGQQLLASSGPVIGCV